LACSDLDGSQSGLRLCRLAESPLGRALPLAKQRPPAIRAVTRDPIFGRDYYEVLSSAKIVLNGSIDMPGANRGSVRCFEALGSGSLLLTDEGNYPEGISNGRKRFEALVASI
jgi:hypothetical protein